MLHQPPSKQCISCSHTANIAIMVFSNEDKAIIKNDLEEKGYTAYKIWKEHQSKGWVLSSVQQLVKRFKTSGTMERKSGWRNGGTSCLLSRRAWHAQESYKSHLQKQLLPSISKLFSHNTWIFLQDSAPSHGSNLVQNFLNETLGNRFVKKTEWPPSSPDCNPLDYYFWNKVKTEVYRDRLNKPFKDEEELKEKIKKVWKDVAFDLPETRESFKEFGKRVRSVEENSGYCIKIIYS